MDNLKIKDPKVIMPFTDPVDIDFPDDHPGSLSIENYTGDEPEDKPLEWSCSLHVTKERPYPENTIMESAQVIFGDDEVYKNKIRLLNDSESSGDSVIMTQEKYDQFVDDAFLFMNKKANGRVISKEDSTFCEMPFGYAFGVPIEIGNKCQIVTNKSTYDPYDPMLKMKYKIRTGFSIVMVDSRADFLYHYPKNEWTAIETLREMISESNFRKYLKYGFILVKGQSGRIYQVFRKRAHTKVWVSGSVVEEICAYIPDKSIPDTDKVIAFKTIIEASEEEFKKLGNVYKMEKAA